ncbi:lipoprotein insertase outer membrane protein LolB [Nitrosomonas sp. PY1]|uniref:lipoprotein insertase outer membrane protein LolB n=1 Tax=Nitrosomonas sp. PY1 TaxID=1803906 RepID=UPI002443B211|nr:lipoprotein insertase outer membrane protein LolB [Nitrosomonas sp. PY1]
MMILAGCATKPQQSTVIKPVKTVVIEAAAKEQTVDTDHFNILGRIAVQDRNQSSSGSFRWKHWPVNDEIILFTPLGQVVAEISRNPQGVRLITSKLEAFYAEDVEGLTQEVLGWRLPLSNLQYWIQGRHSPLARAEKDFNEKDQVVVIRQDGWEIHYSSYTAAQAGQSELPRRMELTYGSLRIKLIVDEWKAE